MISLCYLKPVESHGTRASSKQTYVHSVWELRRLHLFLQLDYILATSPNALIITYICRYVDYEIGEAQGNDEWDTQLLSEATADITGVTYAHLSETCKLGVEWLSCIIFAKFASDPHFSKVFSKSTAVEAYEATLPKDSLADPNSQPPSVLHNMLNALLDSLSEFIEGLETNHFYHLVEICCEKVVCVALGIFRAASKARRKIDPNGPFILQVCPLHLLRAILSHENTTFQPELYTCVKHASNFPSILTFHTADGEGLRISGPGVVQAMQRGDARRRDKPGYVRQFLIDWYHEYTSNHHTNYIISLNFTITTTVGSRDLHTALTLVTCGSKESDFKEVCRCGISSYHMSDCHEHTIQLLC